MADDNNSGRSSKSVKNMDNISYSRAEAVKTSAKTGAIAVDHDPLCELAKTKAPGLDPRFQQQNQTLRCFVMYTDFYRCENILGQEHEACTWFKDVFTQICPQDWVTQWDELRVKGWMPWHKYKTQGDFPGSKYGER